MDDLPTFIRGLGACAQANDAADLLLERLRDICDEAIRGSRWRGAAKMLRGMVHFRADDGYAALHARSFTDKDPDNLDLLASTTASHWVERTNGPVAIDVVASEVATVDSRGTGSPTIIPERDAGPSEQSALALLSRGTTHVLALPLTGAGGGRYGMVTMEAECRDAIEEPFVWPAAIGTATMAADVAAPYLIALPLLAKRSSVGDELIPVIGERMAVLLETLRKFVATGETILLQGPTGAGKSMLAQWCHARSHRANGPFVSVGIAAIPAESQVAELAGRMTADGRQEVGRLAQTRGGTLFLDDVEQLCDEAQGFLLGALERQAFRPLDGAMDQRFDGTVIAATSADLRALVAEGSFREDLLYRLEALPVRLPGLDQRRDELPAWSAWFLSERHMERDGSGETRFTEDAIALLESRSWPGSLRQLRNVVRRAYALALVDQRASDSLLICRKEHVAGALQHELSTQDGPLERLQMLADQLVGDLQNREEAADVLDLVGPVVRALMLHTANEKVGTLRDAYTALGKDQVVRSRNHQKLYRKDLEQLNEWCRLVGIEPPSFADQTLKR